MGNLKLISDGNPDNNIEKYVGIIENMDDNYIIFNKNISYLIKSLEEESGYLFVKSIENVENDIIPNIIYDNEKAINSFENVCKPGNIILNAPNRNLYGGKNSIVPNKLWSIKEKKIIEYEKLKKIYVDEGSLVYMIISYRWGTLDLSFKNANPITEIANIFGIDFIWIDQLCIDQNNEIEKEKEIRKMRYYYKCAQVVTVILPDISNEICKDFNYFSRNIKNYKDIFKISIEKMIKVLNSVSVFGNSEWFHRAWTLQEGLLNTNIIFISKEFTKNNCDCIVPMKRMIHGFKDLNLMDEAFEESSLDNIDKLYKLKYIPSIIKKGFDKYREKLLNKIKDIINLKNLTNLECYIKYNEHCGNINNDNFLNIGEMLYLMKERKSFKKEDMIYAGMALCKNGGNMEYKYNISYSDALYNACISASKFNDWSWLVGFFISENLYSSFIPYRWHYNLHDYNLNNVIKSIINCNKNNITLYICDIYETNIYSYIKNYKPTTFEDIIFKFNKCYIDFNKCNENINEICIYNIPGINEIDILMDKTKLESIILQKKYVSYESLLKINISENLIELLNKDYIFINIVIFNILYFILIPKEYEELIDDIKVLFPFGLECNFGIICVGNYDSLKRIGTFYGKIKKITSTIWKLNII